MDQTKRIFIIGHLGARKSVIGEAVAKKLGWQYIDANPSLERYIGRSLHDMLGTEGEEAFHRCEAEIIAFYKNKDKVIVVLEEGVVASEHNRELLASEFVVYLKVSTAAQMERWAAGRMPVLPLPNLKAFLDKQHLERDALYDEVASISVTPDDDSIEDNVKEIINAVNK